MYDHCYRLSIQTLKEILRETIRISEGSALFEITDSIQPRSFSELMMLAVQNTFETYESEGEFFEFVQLEVQDFEAVAQTQLANDSLTWGLTCFKLDFDDIQDQLDEIIHSKGYRFIEDEYGIPQWIFPKAS